MSTSVKVIRHAERYKGVGNTIVRLFRFRTPGLIACVYSVRICKPETRRLARKTAMTLNGMEVLLLGQSFGSAQALVERLRRLGFRCHFADNLKTARQLSRSLRIDLVLSRTHLSDGTGFGLREALADLPVTVFLCLPVETSCFWLPIIDSGRDCLGLPALRPAEFRRALEEMTRCWRRAADNRLASAGVFSTTC